MQKHVEINRFLNNQWVKEEITKQGKFKKHLETIKNGNETYQILIGSSKSSFKVNIIAINTYFKRIERFQVTNLTLHIKEVGKKKKRKGPTNL